MWSSRSLGLRVTIFFLILIFIYLYLRQTAQAGEGERERETQNLKQALGSELSAQSPMQGSNSWAVRSCPEPKSDAQLTEPPWRRIKLFLHFLQSWCAVYYILLPSTFSLRKAHCRKSHLNIMLKFWKVTKALRPPSAFVQAQMGLSWAEGWGIFNFLKWIKNGLGFFTAPSSRGRVCTILLGVWVGLLLANKSRTLWTFRANPPAALPLTPSHA